MVLSVKTVMGESVSYSLSKTWQAACRRWYRKNGIKLDKGIPLVAIPLSCISYEGEQLQETYFCQHLEDKPLTMVLLRKEDQKSVLKVFEMPLSRLQTYRQPYSRDLIYTDVLVGYERLPTPEDLFLATL